MLSIWNSVYRAEKVKSYILGLKSRVDLYTGSTYTPENTVLKKYGSCRVDSPSGQVAFPSHLPDGQAIRQAI